MGQGEAVAAPPRPTSAGADSDSDIAAMATTTTTMRESFLSPLKRKRDIEIPETPWRLQSAPALEDDEGEKEQAEVDDGDDGEAPETSGQVSPGSRKLASQLEDLNLGGKIAGPLFTLVQSDVMDTATAEEPAAKKMKQKGRATRGMVKYGNGNANGNAEKDGEGAEEKSHSGDKDNTKRVRLRSPPLSKTKDPDASEDDGVAVVDESEDVDSDDQEQLGIGYRPTPTQRYVRSQKRMQQVCLRSGISGWYADGEQIKEYKARISKEAREKRSETRRRRRSFPGRNTAAADAPGENNSDEGARKKTVQFKIDPVV